MGTKWYSCAHDVATHSTLEDRDEPPAWMEEGEHSVTRLEDGEQSTTLQEEYEVSTTQLRVPATWLAGEVRPTSWMEEGGGSATRLEYKGKFADKLEEGVGSAIRLAPLIAMNAFKAYS